VNKVISEENNLYFMEIIMYSKIYKYIFFIIGTLAILLSFLILPDITLAEEPTTEPSLASFAGCTGLDCSACNVVGMANGLIKWLIGILFLLFAALMMIAGVRLVTSAGNPSALSEAKDKFINAIVGFLIVLSAWLIVDTIMKGLVGRAGDDNSRGFIVSDGEASGWLYWSQVECQERIEPKEVKEDDIEYIDLQTDIDSVYDPSSYNPGIAGPAIPSQPAGQICYPGSGSGVVCFQAVTGIAGQAGYQYPSGFQVPPKWIDTQNLGAGRNMSTRISLNYTLGQLNVSATCGNGGRYMYIDPGALARLEQVNSIVGTRLSVNSVHRSPGCNARVGGATGSSHMSGRAFDIQPPGGDRCRVVRACRTAGANFIMTYSSTNHVHCDWRGSGRTERLTITCR